jgi:hypothetical protein
MSKLSERLGASQEDDASTNLVFQLKTLRDKIKAAQEKEKALTKKLSEIAATRGIKDGSGNRSFKMGEYLFIRQRVKYAPEVDEIPCYKLFRAKGFPRPYRIEQVRVFDEDVFNEYESKLTEEEKASIITQKEDSFRTMIKRVGSRVNFDE